MDLVGAIDQGTSSSRFILFQQDRTVVASSHVKSRNIILSEGWLQQDPGEILQAVKDCIEDVCQQCEEKNISLTSIKDGWLELFATMPVHYAMSLLKQQDAKTAGLVDAPIAR